MQDFSSMPATEMFARRDAAENEIAGLIGQFVFTYSRFVTGLHLCVAWHDAGKHLSTYPSIAEDLAVADLLKRIEKQARIKLGDDSSGFQRYKDWVLRAHEIRETRNLIMHSRWDIETFGRHAILISTPIFVEPANEIILTAEQLRQLCQTCAGLKGELNKLREKHPL